MGQFDGKVAFVTGGARDIGRMTSLKLARNGASVCINYFDNPEDADETLKMIEDFGGKAMIVQGDMTNAEDIQRNVDACVEKFGDKIDILVNVAGGLVARKTMDEMDWDFWKFVIELNLGSVFQVTKAVLPHIPSGGAIVNFSSQAARHGGGPGSPAAPALLGGLKQAWGD